MPGDGTTRLLGRAFYGGGWIVSEHLGLVMGDLLRTDRCHQHDRSNGHEHHAHPVPHDDVTTEHTSTAAATTGGGGGSLTPASGSTNLAFTGVGEGIFWVLVTGTSMLLIGVGGRRRARRRASSVTTN